MPNVLYRNHMGDDLEVVNDARISFAATADAMDWEHIVIPNVCNTVQSDKATTWVPVLSKADQNLIGFLARGCRSGEWNEAILDTILANDEIKAEKLLTWAKRLPPHWTPFGQQTIKLRMKAPTNIRTQAFKHKIGFVENEESRRYIKSTPELFIPDFRSAPEGDIKQGSGGIHPLNGEWQNQYIAHCNQAISTYESMIAGGVAPEQARFILPQGVYVNWVWTGSLYAFAEFYNKRADSHAQGEIQDLAREVATIISALFPVSWAALTE
ncbi:FAD-dependent thymidylate synthase [Halomonas sp. 707B3]|uniref:FAD-dependent thymidylate synthase n=1 Tax=Halomonas sp. 707B3 TaxID=1681043 RepID=UPI00209DB7FE|nr:FAD-dependent thymidylate synthase [Halomonas sp. 707B3]MCP1316878.1 FAD-dependent thymidylate synthase [Halomonas sp. 707B3]